MMKKFIGKMFVNPLFDYLFIGGVLSLFAIPYVEDAAREDEIISVVLLPMVMLMSNSAHFAASTVRLYTKEGAYQDFPKLTMLLPLVTIAVLTFAIMYPAQIGSNLQALYLTWSPFHYARQGYGLSVMYSYRAGCVLDKRMKRLLLFSALLPFFLVVCTKENSGLLWVVPLQKLEAFPPLYVGVWALSKTLPFLSFLCPCALFLLLWRRPPGEPMPLISLLCVVTNAAWWVIFDYQSAFIWATVFHGLQYLSIMLIFHVRDQQRKGTSRIGPVYQGILFYASCVTLGYLLFQCWPYFFVWAGFGIAESMLLVVAVINIHHFIVDGYIWKIRKDPNYEIVVSSAPELAPAAA